MHARRVLCFFLGLWLGGAVLAAWVARENRHSVDSALAAAEPAVAATLPSMGTAAARWLLRYEAFEQNRRLYQSWGAAQAVLGVVFLFFMLFGSREGKLSLLLAALMLAIVVVQLIYVGPELAALGRATDFLSPDAPAPDRYRLRLTLMEDKLAEGIKGCFGLALALKLMIRRRDHSGDASKNLDVVNKANYRHINR